MQDSDLDGVSDNLDRCPKTPFFHQVDSFGCSTKILTIPTQSDNNSLFITAGYGYSISEDLLGHQKEHIENIQINYYQNRWNYALNTGVYQLGDKNGVIDTTFKINHRFYLNKDIRLNLGAGVKFNTDDFEGDKSDYILDTSLYYYPTLKLSLFSKYNYTIINDKENKIALTNSYLFNIGFGYFITPKFYSSISYKNRKSKFRSEDTLNSLSSTLYYQWNKKWFTTLLYQEDIYDEDRHRVVNFKIGFKVW